MKFIILTKGKFTTVDDTDFEWLSQWKWCFNNKSAIRGFTISKNKQIMIKMQKSDYESS